MSNDEIIRQRINGSSVRTIARTRGCAVSEANAMIDRLADATIDDKTRNNSFALELARLDQLQETFYAQALDGEFTRTGGTIDGDVIKEEGDG